MLLINETEKKITKEVLKKEFDIENYPVRFRLTNQILKKNPSILKRGEQSGYGKSFAFPSFFTTHDSDKGSLEIRYYKTTNGIGEKMTYLPNEVIFGHTADIMLSVKQADLIYFLLIHERNAKSKYRDPQKKAWFYLEDLAKDASAKAIKKKLLNKVDTLLWNEEHGLSIQKIGDVAKSFEISGVDKMTIDQIRVSMEPIAKKDPDLFLERAGAKKDLSVLTLIADCVDYKIIANKKVRNKASWYMLTDTGQKDEKICSVRPGEKAVDRLASYLVEFDETNTKGYLKTKLEEAKLMKEQVA